MKGNGTRGKKTAKRDASQTLEVLFEISEAVTTTHNLDELYRVIHRSLGKILNVDNFYIALYHEKKDSISFPYHVDEKDDHPGEIFNISKTASLTGQVINARVPLILLEKDILDFAKKHHQNTVRSISKIWIGSPLIIKKRVIGVIAMQSYNSPDDYTAEDSVLMTTVSQHIALAIERKESDEKLAKQRNILEKILESSPVGICLVENRVFKWVNNEMLKMFGYEKKEDFENKDARMIYTSDAAYEKAGKIIYQDLKEKGKSDFDFDLKRQDSTIFKAHIIITSSDIQHPIENTIVTLADISQREMAQKEKMEKEKLQGVLEMAGAVCHEINQPLQSIMGYATLYQDNESISDRELKNIQAQAMRIGKITKRLSNITQYKTINYPGNTRIVDIWGSSNDLP
jgi:PAS domain S-box-containing protein